jgi:hypothetical protein
VRIAHETITYLKIRQTSEESLESAKLEEEVLLADVAMLDADKEKLQKSLEVSIHACNL